MNISYFAGIIDGEGSIGIEHLSPTKNRSKSYYVCRLTVINTNKDLMESLKNFFGGTYDQRKKIEGRRICYRWHIFGKELESALNQLIPHLFIKKPQALILKQYRETVGKTGWKVSDSILEKRKEFWIRCKELNKLG